MEGNERPGEQPGTEGEPSSAALQVPVEGQHLELELLLKERRDLFPLTPQGETWVDTLIRVYTSPGFGGSLGNILGHAPRSSNWGATVQQLIRWFRLEFIHSTPIPLRDELGDLWMGVPTYTKLGGGKQGGWAITFKGRHLLPGVTKPFEYVLLQLLVKPKASVRLTDNRVVARTTIQWDSASEWLGEKAWKRVAARLRPDYPELVRRDATQWALIDEEGEPELLPERKGSLRAAREAQAVDAHNEPEPSPEHIDRLYEEPNAVSQNVNVDGRCTAHNWAWAQLEKSMKRAAVLPNWEDRYVREQLEGLGLSPKDTVAWRKAETEVRARDLEAVFDSAMSYKRRLKSKKSKRSMESKT
jgi:hypothetical protein